MYEQSSINTADRYNFIYFYRIKDRINLKIKILLSADRLPVPEKLVYFLGKLLLLLFINRF